MTPPIFITGIGTDVGKTIVSAILCEAWKTFYWKPIQAGIPSDKERIDSLVTYPEFMSYPEKYILKTPASPHYAAAIENRSLLFSEQDLPVRDHPLIIEGAGGLMVPVNSHQFMLDLVRLWNCEVVIVCRDYLGFINHTLLTCEVLKMAKIPVKGIVFTGNPAEENRNLILEHTGIPCLGTVPWTNIIDNGWIRQMAGNFRP